MILIVIVSLLYLAQMNAAMNSMRLRSGRKIMQMLSTSVVNPLQSMQDSIAAVSKAMGVEYD